ncbi:hypothetical protein [Candidatus Uabimicrobium amorphum]|uniref:Peptidase S74 domain-containing protein n=1 Tax=Uabimicrobium amorphum TaxID=2596890 RepID=A0A5S9ITE3_UABAM|nr:hypothetical protein [Candidatus Uabimicrobium amorphum]BBM86295.1 hypothetical protein UABAM_04681 [Candidatus Uabimicrobium amorphum]
MKQVLLTVLFLLAIAVQAQQVVNNNLTIKGSSPTLEFQRPGWDISKIYREGAHLKIFNRNDHPTGNITLQTRTRGLLIVQNNTGNVGIGTTTPSAKLQVEGNTLVNGGLDVNGNTTTYKVHFRGSDMWMDRDSDKIRIRNGGKVLFEMGKYLKIRGDNRNITIEEADSPGAFLILGNATGNAGQFAPTIAMKSNRKTDMANLIYAYAMNEASDSPILNFISRMENGDVTQRTLFRFANNRTSVLEIEANGSVGIGTTNPSAKLHVEGDTFVNGNVKLSKVNFQGSDMWMDRDSDKIRIRNGGKVLFEMGKYLKLRGDNRNITIEEADSPGAFLVMGNATGNTGQFVPTISMKSNRKTDMANIIYAYAMNETSDSPILNFISRMENGSVTQRTLFRFANNKTSVLEIEANGNVGIGTATPSAKLHVEGDANITGNIKANGNVYTQGNDVYFHKDSSDLYHGIGMYDKDRKFSNMDVNGPVVYGFNGGALGSTEGGQKVALRWDSQRNVSVTASLKVMGNVKTNTLDLNGGGEIKRTYINGRYYLRVDSENLDISNMGISTKGRDVYFHKSAGDFFNGIGMYDKDRKFSNVDVNGPVVYGFNGGALGSTYNSKKIAVRWDSNQNVSMNGNLFVAGQITGEINASGRVHTQGNDVYFHKNSSDLYNGIGMYDKDRTFGFKDVNGPVVYGWNGGALGSTEGGQKVALRWDSKGNVGIGVMDTQGSKLAVKGKITAQEIRITNMDSWADFVFTDDYPLLPIDELEQSIEKNGHLPNIPSEKQVKEKGIQLGEMQAKLLQKIEELTLYTIQQNKQIQSLQTEKRQLHDDNQNLENRIQKLEKKWQMLMEKIK